MSVGEILYPNYNKKDQCSTEIINRSKDNTTQINVYVNDLKDKNIVVLDGEAYLEQWQKSIGINFDLLS